MSPSDFFAEELERALQEQSFGIRDFTIISTASLKSSARVTLLEGRVIQVTLTIDGYSIESDEPDNRQGTFETIEDALRSSSPCFEQKRQSALIQALEKLG